MWLVIWEWTTYVLQWLAAAQEIYLKRNSALDPYLDGPWPPPLNCLQRRTAFRTPAKLRLRLKKWALNTSTWMRFLDGSCWHPLHPDFCKLVRMCINIMCQHGSSRHPLHPDFWEFMSMCINIICQHGSSRHPLHSDIGELRSMCINIIYQHGST